jgi:excisionase family DNA binding protein
MLILRRSKRRRDPTANAPVLPHVAGPAVAPLAAATRAATESEPPRPPFLSLREAADWLCVSPSTMKRTIAKGYLATVRVGKHRKVPASYLAAYVAKDVLLPDQVVSIPTGL